MRSRTLLLKTLLLLLVAAPAPAAVAQAGAQPAKDLGGKVLDLVFRIEDLGGGKTQDLGVKTQELALKVKDLEVKESATEVRIELSADVLFDFDKAVLLPKAKPTLKQAADIIRGKVHGAVRIEGHTDGKGSDAYNQRLSERRAAAVKSWFITKEGLRNVPFATQGFGAKKPVAPNTKLDGSDDPVGRQKNRRVEIIVKK